MLTGRYAFDGDSLPAIVYRVVNEAPVPAVTLRPQLPPDLARLLARMLHKNPEARPDARSLVSALHVLAPAAPPASAQPPSEQVSRLLRVLAFGAPIGVFLLIGLGIIVIEHFISPAPRSCPSLLVTARQLLPGYRIAARCGPDAGMDVNNGPLQAAPAETPTGSRRPNRPLPCRPRQETGRAAHQAR